MVYPYIVKHNGVYYPAGADVPVDSAEEKSEESEDDEESDPQGYTRTSIQQMRKSELLDLAASVGIETDENTTGSQLKEALLEHFGL